MTLPRMQKILSTAAGTAWRVADATWMGQRGLRGSSASCGASGSRVG